MLHNVLLFLIYVISSLAVLFVFLFDFTAKSISTITSVSGLFYFCFFFLGFVLFFTILVLSLVYCTNYLLLKLMVMSALGFLALFIVAVSGQNFQGLCKFYPYEKQSSGCYKPTCIKPIVSCPNDLAWDYVRFGDLECKKKECNPMTKVVTFAFHDQTYDVVSTTMQGLEFCIPRLSTLPFSINLATAEVGNCEAGRSFAQIEKGIINCKEEIRACCGPYCKTLKNGDSIPEVFKYCFKIEFHSLKDKTNHGYIINLDSLSCEEIKCFFCAEVIFWFQCNESWSWIFWFFSWSICLLTVSLIVYLKYKLFILSHRFVSKKMLERKQAKLRSLSQDDLDNEDETIILMESPKSTSSVSSLTRTGVMALLLGTANACGSNFDLMISGELGTLGQGIFPITIGQSVCFTMNKAGMQDLSSLKLVSYHLHPEIELSYQTTSSLWKISTWEESVTRFVSYLDEGRVCKTICKKLVVDHVCRRLCNDNSEGHLYKIRKWIPEYTVLFERPSINQTKLITFRHNEVKESDGMIIQALSTSFTDNQWTHHLLKQNGKNYLVPDNLVSAIGNPEAGKVGSWQSLNGKDVKISMDIATKLDPENCYHWAGLMRSSYDDCDYIHQDPAVENYAVPFDVTEGSFVDNKKIVEFHPNVNVKAVLHVELPFVANRRTLIKDCEVKKVTAIGVLNQPSGLHLIINTDKLDSMVEIKTKEWQSCFAHQNNECEIITSAEKRPDQVSWKCGSEQGVIEVIGEVNTYPNIHKYGSSLSMDVFKGVSNPSGFFSALDDLHVGGMFLSLQNNILIIIALVIIIRII